MRVALAAALTLALVAPAVAADKLSGPQIEGAFRDNTVSGRYASGGFFTEFHAPDGRASGHNGWQKNTDACWITKEDQVCYYYGPPASRTTHCFTVELTGDLYVLRNAANGAINALARIEPGNPRKHGEKDEPWYCDGMISKAPEPQMSRRLASR